MTTNNLRAGQNFNDQMLGKMRNPAIVPDTGEPTGVGQTTPKGKQKKEKEVNKILYKADQLFETQKVLIAAKYANEQIEVKDQLPLDKFPLGLTPAFEDGQVHLFGADAIAKHLAADNATYVPKCPTVDQWLLWSESKLLPNVLAYVLPSLSFAHVDNAAVEQAQKELHAQLQKFDKILVTRTFLVGERISVADVSVALNLLAAFQNVFDDKARNSFVNLTRWFTTVINQKQVKDVVGKVKLAESVAIFNADLFKKNSASAPKKDGKAQGKNDGEKKEVEKSAAKQQEEPEDDTPAQPKFVDPFASMPPGTFSMDGFKRVYSDKDNVTKAISWFWENFDAENYSIWFAEYKHPQNFDRVYKIKKMLRAMFKRLEKLNKYAFASFCIFGTGDSMLIKSIWIWRGRNLALNLSPDWQTDYESYVWTKLNSADEKTKKTVNAYLAWEGFERSDFMAGLIFE